MTYLERRLNPHLQTQLTIRMQSHLKILKQSVSKPTTLPTLNLDIQHTNHDAIRPPHQIRQIKHRLTLLAIQLHILALHLLAARRAHPRRDMQRALPARDAVVEMCL